MRAVPNRAKTYFPPVKQPRTGDLSWAPIEPPPGAVNKEQVSTLLAKIPLSALTRNLQAQGALSAHPMDFTQQAKFAVDCLELPSTLEIGPLLIACTACM